MKYNFWAYGAIAVLALVGIGSPVTWVSAHEEHAYEIKGVPYEIIVGSLGEPVIVDDKTGVDLEIVRKGTPLVGANNTLQVELIAGDTKRTLSLNPVWGSEGRYKANFITTVATTISYRFFGTLEGVPIDLTYTCNPAGHPQSEENKERVTISPDVVQTLKSGAFGCPQSKAAFGFPEPASEIHLLAQDVKAQSAEVPVNTAPAADESSSLITTLLGFLSVSVLVLLFLVVRLYRKPTL